MKKNMTVLTLTFRPTYYLRHPLKLLSEIKSNLINAWNRITKGYCYSDIWNFDSWFLEIAPEMLLELSNGSGFPDNDGFDTYEKWQNWLRQQANNLIACREEEVENQNEYKKEFEKEMRRRYSKQFKPNDSDMSDVYEKYFKRNSELHDERKARLISTLNELGRHWFHLWD